MKINFYLRYHTVFGEELFISGNNQFLGDEDISKAIPLSWMNDDFWHGSIIFPDDFDDLIHYRYILKDLNGIKIFDGEDSRVLDLSIKKPERVIDTWNAAGDIANVFFTRAFNETLLPAPVRIKSFVPKKITHEFRVKAPLLRPGETVCLCGSTKNLKNWDTSDPILLSFKNNWYIASICLEENEWPATYKYGVYDVNQKKFLHFEQGENRILKKFEDEGVFTILHDGFINYPFSGWRGAGVSIPVFSLRSQKSFGVGEFNDIKLLINWANKTGLKLIQFLPVNDTTAFHDWQDSYPYAAISAFALHPMYINLETVAGKEFASIIKPLRKKQKQLNALKELDYDQVMKFKISALRELYDVSKDRLKNDLNYFEFFELNRHWLVPYAVFCYLRDKYKTADFSKWRRYRRYNESSIQRLAAPSQRHYDEIAFFYFVQYHLHLQMKEISRYAHEHKIVLKGDIPIGIYRFGCDAWTQPSLYNMSEQAGAPPDDFAVKGQNWGFPTYNWEEMSKDNFNWWRMRFDQMSNYFDAFRIDHILGFFRIWSIPVDQVEGILGRFVPAVPVDISEFNSRGISFQHDRYCKPFITDDILRTVFKDHFEEVKEKYLIQNSDRTYRLKDVVNTQAKVTALFGEDQKDLRQGLFDLISNVILLEEIHSDGTQFHFRISIDKTSSFIALDQDTKDKLWSLYINYFYERQNDFWKKEGMKRLPRLKRNTNMLVFGEDLGMVPPCVPEVMRQLGILGLEIERMPKKWGAEFFHPNDAPYLSVVTPSTHDMSTIRGWWEEDKERSQRFYNFMLGQYGEAPANCEGWINKKIVVQHLYSPAMWSIFQLSDLLGMDENIRRQDPKEETINVPADSDHYWNYRMHINLEELLKQNEMNLEIKKMIVESGRGS